MKPNTVRLALAALIVVLIAATGCPHENTTYDQIRVLPHIRMSDIRTKNIEGYWTTDEKPDLILSCAIATFLLRSPDAPEETAQYRAAAKEMVGNIVAGLANPRNGFIQMKTGIDQGELGHACALIFLVKAWQSDLEFTDEERKMTRGVIVRAIEFIEKDTLIGLSPRFHTNLAQPGYGEYDVAIEYIHALKAARKAGFAVNDKVIAEAEDYIKRALKEYE